MYKITWDKEREEYCSIHALWMAPLVSPHAPCSLKNLICSISMIWDGHTLTVNFRCFGL